MWQGQQPPGGEPNPQHQNPYQQPGYQQPNPYQQQPHPYQQPGQSQWGAPTQEQPPSGGGGGKRTKVVVIAAATAVVVAAGVAGFLLLGGNKDAKAKDAKASASSSQSAKASPSESDDEARGTETDKPTVPGWKVVVNPKWGVAFDVPADWEVMGPDRAAAFSDVKTGEPIAYLGGIASYKSKWCTSDDDKDGHTDDTSLATTGTKGAKGAKNTDDVALNTVYWWVYAPYTQPDKKSISVDEKAQPYTTNTGVKGSIAWAWSTNSPSKGKGKCESDGKAVSFGFKNSAGDFVSWTFYGAKGVGEEVPKKTIMKILSTVRLHGDPAAH
ncbi:hypothetical protein [Streptomyces colonosanans]|uniref:DUF8017 domain-containing protein n=1 Tax=Streptomyces colonosanans TaxID=1428652 RepID=A0A1S2NXG9_9ACTN|nr:hypothetical protein [Streptomyces colonosanans]OIJ86189.1 hypothetical protein BIV24_27125 [Streptomyces colonosanans]